MNIFIIYLYVHYLSIIYKTWESSKNACWNSAQLKGESSHVLFCLDNSDI